MQDKHAIIISGLGVKGPGYDSAQALWERLLQGGEAFPGHFRTNVPLENDLAYVIEPQQQVECPPVQSRSEWLALQTVAEALNGAGLEPAQHDTSRWGVYYGTAMGSIDRLEAMHVEAAVGEEMEQEAHQLFNISQLIASRFDCFGPNEVISTACAASLYAIGMASRLIKNGQADVMIVGGTEICSRIALSCFNRLGGLDKRHCRPFDQSREGTLFGEGAATLILESEAHFKARQAQHAYARVAGFGWSCDGFHATAPNPDGEYIQRAAEQALLDQNGRLIKVDCIIPHGTGTQLNDAVEYKVMSSLLSTEEQNTPWVPLKGLLGHSAGAAGAFSAVVAAMIAHHKQIPAAINKSKPEFSLNLPEETQLLPELQHVLINSYGFGGNNASVLIGALSTGVDR